MSVVASPASTNGLTPPPAPKQPPREKLAETAGAFVTATLALLPVLVLLRVYELFIARASHPLPDGAIGLFLRGLRSDVGLTLWAGAAFAVPVLLVGLASPRAARIVHRVLLALLVVLGVLLAQYFAVTFVPLGSDLYGYSLADIRETAGASKGVGVATFIPVLLFAALSWFAAARAARRRPSRGVIGVTFGAILAATLFSSLFRLSRGAYPSDASYYFATNKTVYFAGRSIDYVRGGNTPRAGAAKLSGYPLLHDATYDDVLGPLMQTGSKRPNLVFIVVEGLGRDFVGAGARYGGFTPFIDSLTTQSLYWKNFVSTSGRTFSVLPSLLASAPYGRSGFMELGANMPRHVSLVSLLGEQGYRTSYFTGTQGHFDNIDVFMNREGVDQFIDQSKFPATYQMQPGENGFSWGYGDQDLMRHSLEVIGPPNDRPRLDVYLTITTHEPFIPPRTAEYDARFQQRLAALSPDASRRRDFVQNEQVFRTLLYLDDAIRLLIDEYRKRSDFDRTIFFITGDHRLIPLPEQGRLDRYHVPFIVYSPMIRTPRTFASVSSHLDVTPSVLALLSDKYGMTFPKQVSWLGTGLDTAQGFRNVHSFALMRTKNNLDDYLDGTTLLSGDELFRLDSGFHLTPLSDSRARTTAEAKLDAFRQINAFVTAGDHLYPGGQADSTDAQLVASEDSVFRTLSPADTAPDRAFRVAQQRAFAGDYVTARLMARRILRNMPNEHDARTLVARTFAWDKQYDSARVILHDVLRRAGQYADASAALTDVELWSGHPRTALAVVDSALVQSPREPELLFGRAKALEALNRKRDALAVLDTLESVHPNFEGAADVRRRLKP